MLKIGAHTPFVASKYLLGAGEFMTEINGNAMMIYLGAPQNSRRADPSKYNYQMFLKQYPHFPSENIVVHAPYIINPASVEKFSFAIDFLVAEIQRMNYINAKYLVLHPGAYTKWTRAKGIETLVNSLKMILSKTKNVTILLENMAGKGTELGSTFEELSLILDKVNNSRLGICLDTCHAWDAGYNLHDLSDVILKLKATNLLDKVKVIHVNDSKNDLNSHRDLHQNIGQGYIGLKTLQDIVHNLAFKNVIKILETPYINAKPPYKKEIEMLKNIV